MDSNSMYALLIIGIIYLVLVILLMCKFRRVRQAETSTNLYENFSRSDQSKFSNIKRSKPKDAECTVQLPPKNVYEHIKRRPIAITDFETTLQALKSNKCALLNAEFADIKMVTNDEHGSITFLTEESECDLSNLERQRSLNYTKAAYIQGFTHEKNYIAALSPTKSGLSDFWRTVWEQDVRVMVTLCETKVDKSTVYTQYFPDVKQTMIYRRILVHHVLQVAHEDFTVGDLEVQYGDSRRYIKHLQFHSWSVSDCVPNARNFLTFIEVVRNRVLALNTGTPILVHSSEGLGRTGTFIALDCLTQEACLKSEIDVFNRVLNLCSDRMHLIRTRVQYLFIYECVFLFLKEKRLRKLSTVISNSNHYANITHNNESPYANLPHVQPPSGKEEFQDDN